MTGAKEHHVMHRTKTRSLPPIVFGIGLAAVMALGPTPASAEVGMCHRPTLLCVYFHPTGIVDDDVGETKPNYNYGFARGVRVLIIRPPPEPPLELYLANNCAEFHTEYSTGLKAVVYAESMVGDPAFNVRPYRCLGDFEREKETQERAEYTWVFDLNNALEHANPLSAWERAFTIFIPASPIQEPIDPEDLACDPSADPFDPDCECKPDTDDPFVPMLAAGTEVMGRISDLDALPPVLPPNRLVRLIYTRASDNAWYDFDRVGPRLTPKAYNSKFIIAHEGGGHWLQHRWASGWPARTGYPSIDDPCMFWAIPQAQSSHGIRSAEWSSLAMSEGFAHFVASVAFNQIDQEDGVFKYYKEIDLELAPWYADFVDPTKDDRRVSLKGGTSASTWGGPDAWVRNQCVNDFETPLQTETEDSEVTTELDWLRFWWHFVTSDDSGLGNPGTFKEVVQLIAYTQMNYPWGNLPSGFATEPHFFWPQLEAACDDLFPGHSQRLQLLMEKFGVYCEEDDLNPGTCK